MSQIPKTKKRIELLIQHLKCKCFLNAGGIPMIQSLMLDGTDSAIPIGGKKLRCCLARIAYDDLDFLPEEQELTRCVSYLHGLAFKNQLSTFSQKEALDQCPLLEAINILIRNQDNRGQFCVSASALLCELNRVAEVNGIDTREKTWPKAANHLSKAIRERQSTLLILGIRSTIDRKPGGDRFIRFELQCDDTVAPSSHPSSAPNLPVALELQPSDARDDANEHLFQSISTGKGGLE